MNGARDHVLAHAAFAAEQNGGAGGRHAPMVAKISRMAGLRPTMLSNS